MTGCGERRRRFPLPASSRSKRESKGAAASRWGLTALGALILSGCGTTRDTRAATAPIRPDTAVPQGSYHGVTRGETLWRIARSFGLDVDMLAAANRLSDTSHLEVGRQLFVPLPPDTRRFLWPVLGALERPGIHGVEITAPAGSWVRASRAGRVAVAAHRLSGWGKAVILDHLDGYLSVYAGLAQLLVTPGADLKQGGPLGSVGSRALYFEIRYGAAPKDALALLPTE